MNEGDIIDEVSGIAQGYARKYQLRVPDVDLEQELNLALLLMIRANPEKTFEDLTKMASKCMYRATVDIIRARTGRGAVPKPTQVSHPDPSMGLADLSDPANLAAIQEAFDDLRGFGHAESVILDALVNPSDALKVATLGSKHPRVTLTLPEIREHYGIGFRPARRALRRIHERLTHLTEEG